MAKESLIPIERIASQIYVIRGEKVMLDSDLAALYDVTTGNLNKAMKRNRRRFPDDFVFQLSGDELEALRFQVGRANEGRGGRRSPPYAFTEQGVAMLSSVLRSDRAAEINVVIMRTFVRLRQVLATNKDLARKVARHDRQIAVLFEHVKTVVLKLRVGTLLLCWRYSAGGQRQKPPARNRGTVSAKLVWLSSVFS